MKQKLLSATKFKREGYEPASAYWMPVFELTVEDFGWIVDTPIPKQIRPLVDFFRKRWNQDLPVSVLDDLSHGDKGHVMFFTQKDQEREEPSFQIYGRISYGASSRNSQMDFNFSNMERLHLGIQAIKRFNNFDYGKKLITENTYITLRWDSALSGTAHTNLNEMPFHNQTPTFYEGKQFDPIRMTFSQSSHTDYEAEMPISDIEFPVNNTTIYSLKGEKRKPFRWYLEYGGSIGIDTIPSIGYEPIFEVLSRYGDVSLDDMDFLKASNPLQGIEYYMNSLVPAVENYAKSFK